METLSKEKILQAMEYLNKNKFTLQEWQFLKHIVDTRYDVKCSKEVVFSLDKASQSLNGIYTPEEREKFLMEALKDYIKKE